MEGLAKYRSWSKENKCFSYFLNGEYFSDIECKHLLCTTETFFSLFSWDLAERFTGIKDSNEAEIYEGDIDAEGYIVSYSGDQHEGLGMNVGFYLQRDDFESWIELQSRCNFNCDNHTIIGHIHEKEAIHGLSQN